MDPKSTSIHPKHISYTALRYSQAIPSGNDSQKTNWKITTKKKFGKSTNNNSHVPVRYVTNYQRLIHGEPLGSHGSDQLPMGSSQRLSVEPEVLFFTTVFFQPLMDAIIQFYPIQFYPLIIAYNFHSIIIVMTCYNPLRWPEKGYEWRFTKIARTTPNPPHSHLVHPGSGDRNDSPCCSTAPGHRSTKGEKKR